MRTPIWTRISCVLGASMYTAYTAIHTVEITKNIHSKPSTNHSWLLRIMKMHHFSEFNGIQQIVFRSLLSLVRWVVWSLLVVVVIRDTTSSEEVAKTSSADGVYICYHLCITYWTINSDRFSIRYPSTLLLGCSPIWPCPLSTGKYGFCFPHEAAIVINDRCRIWFLFVSCIFVNLRVIASIDALGISISFCRQWAREKNVKESLILDISWLF